MYLVSKNDWEAELRGLLDEVPSLKDSRLVLARFKRHGLLAWLPFQLHSCRRRSWSPTKRSRSQSSSFSNWRLIGPGVTASGLIRIWTPVIRFGPASA